MRLARYHGAGVVRIEDEPVPTMIEGGLLVRSEACGLCSGELMDWYMDRKVPHVFGHEVCGVIERSGDPRFPEGARVFVHHHAPCFRCDSCQRGQHVHCHQWKATKLVPGGMAERWTCGPENLNDAFLVEDLRPIDAALIEPLACVMKSLSIAEPREEDRCAVIGLGVMGLMHMLALPPGAVGFDLLEPRRSWASSLGLIAEAPETSRQFDVVVVCPGTPQALDFGLAVAAPGARIVLFAPMPPGERNALDLNSIYFRDLRLLNSYSCGPDDTRAAAALIRSGKVRAEQVVSDFISLDSLPSAYVKMKAGSILKAMVVFD